MVQLTFSLFGDPIYEVLLVLLVTQRQMKAYHICSSPTQVWRVELERVRRGSSCLTEVAEMD